MFFFFFFFNFFFLNFFFVLFGPFFGDPFFLLKNMFLLVPILRWLFGSSFFKTPRNLQCL